MLYFIDTVNAQSIHLITDVYDWALEFIISK